MNLKEMLIAVMMFDFALNSRRLITFQEFLESLIPA